MPIGWVRAYRQEVETFGFTDSDDRERNARAEFRRDFETVLRETASGTGTVLRTLRWGDELELPEGISSVAASPFTRVRIEGDEGFVPTAHLVEVAYVAARPNQDRGYQTALTYPRRGKTVSRTLLWGDCAQILSRDGDVCLVRGRGYQGSVPTAHLTATPLVEVYFIDVGQGDGVLVRTPDRRHLLIDGGLERTKQQTGHNAADFVDWKFFQDYGDFRVRLESMVASHSDNDHYGGLHDLVRRDNFLADRELDCLGVDIGTFYHPGLSRWESRAGTQPAHHDGLGPREVVSDDFNYFIRLLNDRADAETAIVNGAETELSGPWKSFVRALLENSDDTTVERLGVSREALRAGSALPDLWDDTEGYAIKVLAPVTAERPTGPGLPDLGPKSYNTNGHSLCLRIDIGLASILLTGDLNKPSMDWLAESYGDRIGAWLCDVAKACHHGSHKVSYRFLESMRPAATIISSGDAEGHGHPRPEIVGASAMAGRVEIDREGDKLLTPLIYMTEIERSVSLGAVERIDYLGMPGDSEAAERQSGSLVGRHVEAMSNDALLSDDDLAEIRGLPDDAQSARRNQLRAASRARFRAQEAAILDGSMRVRVASKVPRGPLSAKLERSSLWRSRVMRRNHYGLVNVRTDGTTVMCATMDETEEDWIIHTFPARTRVRAD